MESWKVRLQRKKLAKSRKRSRSLRKIGRTLALSSFRIIPFTPFVFRCSLKRVAWSPRLQDRDRQHVAWGPRPQERVWQYVAWGRRPQEWIEDPGVRALQATKK